MRTLRTNRETTPEGFHDEVLSDHITRHREVTQQVNDPQSMPAHEVARVRSDVASVLRLIVCWQGMERFDRVVSLLVARQ